nr:ribonuclease H-like domain-containing protein [Tanacetum cinerariifolium]
MMYQIDVKTAFLYGTFKEKIYVDDIIFGLTNNDLCKAFEKLMKDKFQMSSMGDFTFFLGLQVKQKQDGKFISQDKYVAEILRKFGLTDRKSASTPIDTEKSLLKDPDAKSDASEGFDQIIDFLNASSIKYALTVNPNIYGSCIKQFWTSVSVKMVDDVTRLQALVDKKKVIITEATIRDALRLNDAEGINCLPNEEIFTKLSRMGGHHGMSLVPLWLQLSSAFPQQADESAAEVNVDDVSAAGVADKGAASVAIDDVPAAFDEPSIPSPTPPTQPPLPSQDLPSTSQGRIIANMDADDDVTMQDVADIDRDVAVDVEIKESANDDELKPIELKEVVEVVTTAKLMTEVVTAALATITAGVVIRDLEETATPSIIIHTEPKSKDKGKWIMVYEPKPLKKKTQIQQDEAYATELEAELNKNIN